MENEENVMIAEQTAIAEDEVRMDVAVEAEDKFEEKKQRQYLEVTQEMLDETKKRLLAMLDYLCLDVTALHSEKRNSRIHLVVTSSDAGRIIGRKGQSLESLQLLLNRMMQKDNVNYPKINIDIDGYPAKDGSDEKPRRTPRGNREDRPQRKDRRERRGGFRTWTAVRPHSPAWRHPAEHRWKRWCIRSACCRSGSNPAGQARTASCLRFPPATDGRAGLQPSGTGC